MGDSHLAGCLVLALIAPPLLIKAALEDIRRIRRYGWPKGSSRGGEFSFTIRWMMTGDGVEHREYEL